VTIKTQGTQVQVRDAGGTLRQILGVVSFSGPGGQAAVIDATTLASTRKEKDMGLPDEGQFTLTCKWLSADVGQLRLLALRAAGTVGSFLVTYANGSTDTFSGLVLGAPRSGGTDAHIEVTYTIEVTGEVVTA
jgi:hypothetical protein